MFIKILMGLILFGLIGGVAYVALSDVDIPQEQVVIEINATPSQ